MRIAFALALLALVSCTRQADWPHEGKFAGVYTSGFEYSLFVPKGTKEMWWLNGGVPCEVAPGSLRAPRPVVYIEVLANLSDKGSFGHLGRYGREITPSEFVSCREATADEWKYLTAGATS